MKRLLPVVFAIMVAPLGFAQPAGRTAGTPPGQFDSVAVQSIITEGMEHSQVMAILSEITDICGPRLTCSPGFFKAIEWARSKLAALGLDNAHFEGWGPFGKGWELKRFSANVLSPEAFPLIAYPKAWSPGTHGELKGQAVLFNASTDSALESFKGKLKGRIVLLDEPRDLQAHFTPDARRDNDSTLLLLADANPETRQGRFRFRMPSDFRQRALIAYRKQLMCEQEGARALLDISPGDYGTMFVQAATVPVPPDTPFARRIQPYNPKAPAILPQFVVAAEHYNRIARMLNHDVPVTIELNLEVEFNDADSAYNVIAELPGSDLKDEVVMIGAHFDSWHAGTGATDDGAGVAACMEAMRILKTLGLKPRRTIRIGLWAGEEQGLLGSRAYVARHFGEAPTPAFGGGGVPAAGVRPVALKPEAENFSCYFNDDNGTGRFRGIYLQGNESVRSIFRDWLEPFRSMGASTITPLSTGSTDHVSFDAVGLPGFQFIQDPIDYSTRTHHSNMDVFDRIQQTDEKQDAVMMACFAYNAAMMDAKLPRK